MNLDRLFLMCVDEVLKENKIAQWEEIIKKCFEKFHDEFSLVKYDKWPDTWKIHNCMWRCRNQRKWIDGNNKVGYFLTDFGKEVIKSSSKKNFGTDDIKLRKRGIGSEYMLLKNI